MTTGRYGPFEQSQLLLIAPLFSWLSCSASLCYWYSALHLLYFFLVSPLCTLFCLRYLICIHLHSVLSYYITDTLLVHAGGCWKHICGCDMYSTAWGLYFGSSAFVVAVSSLVFPRLLRARNSDTNRCHYELLIPWASMYWSACLATSSSESTFLSLRNTRSWRLPTGNAQIVHIPYNRAYPRTLLQCVPSQSIYQNS